MRPLAIAVLLGAALGCGADERARPEPPPAAQVDDAAAAVAVAQVDDAVGTEVTLRVLGMT